MQKQDGRSFVMVGVGTSLLSCSFDEDRDEVTVTCPGCQAYYVAPVQSGVAERTLEHEHDCQLLTLIESFVNQGGLNGN
jgi:hypothetical protein